MTRKAILIGGTGLNSTNSYLDGVDLDLNHFTNFLNAPIGGSWDEGEILRLLNSDSDYFMEIFNEIQCDYILVYFAGHGNYNLYDTNIAINNKKFIPISQLLELITTPKALIILDLYSKEKAEISPSLSYNKYLSFNPTTRKNSTSEKHKQMVSGCDEGFSICYSSAVGENSYGTDFGGAFTYSLLKTTLDWYLEPNKELILNIDNAIKNTHNFMNSNFNIHQSPQIRKSTNSKLNFPFAIK